MYPFLDLVDQVSGVLIHEELNFMSRDRRRGNHAHAVRYQRLQQLDDRARTAEVLVRAQTDPPGKRHGCVAIQLLHRVFEPEDTGVFSGMPLDQIEPFRLDILPFVHDDRIEQQFRRDRQRRAGLDELVKRPCQIEVRHRARLPQHPFAQHVECARHSARRRNHRDVIGQWPVEAKVKRPAAAFDRCAVFG
ncbi:hypothetical protein D3C72_1520000 [compost metagenome]